MGARPKSGNGKPRLVCPGCEKEVRLADYYMDAGFVGEAVAAITNFIECTKCGYYGLPIEIKFVGKKKASGKKVKPKKALRK